MADTVLEAKSALKLFHSPLDLSGQAVLRKRGLLKRRGMHGHIQYFTKDTASETLQDVGYEILDFFYTPRGIDLGTALAQKVARFPRKICFAMYQDLPVRILGD